MTEKNILIQKKNEGGGFDTYYPKTKVGNLVEGASGILNALKTVDGAGSGLDADFIDGYNAKSLAREVIVSSITPTNIQYEATEFVSNDTQSANIFGAYPDWKDSGKNITINCDLANYLQVDAALGLGNLSGTFTKANIEIQLKDNQTGEVFYIGKYGYDVVDSYFYWVSGKIDISHLTGNRVFSVELRGPQTQSNQYPVRNRELDCHKNLTRQVKW